MKNFLVSATILAFSWSMAITGSTGVYAQSIDLKAQIEVDREPLTLSKIVDGPVDNGLRSLELGSLPSPGNSRIISRTYIKMQAKLQEKPAPKFSGETKQTRILRPEKSLRKKELRRKIKKLVKKRRALGDHGKVEINNVPEDLQIASGSFQLEFKRNQNPYKNHRGKETYRFSVIQNGNEIKTFQAGVTITMKRKVALAVRSLSRNEELTESKIEWKTKDLANYNGIPITKDRDPAMYVLKRSVRAGEIINESYLKRPNVIERRDKITIQYIQNGLTITAKGEALEDGAVGDRIEVENLASEQEITGTVKKSGLVKVTS